MDTVKQKFYRMDNPNKKVGNPTFPPHIRRAKIIAWSTLSGATPVRLRNNYDSDEEVELTTPNEQTPLGCRRNSRDLTSAGVSSVSRCINLYFVCSNRQVSCGS